MVFHDEIQKGIVRPIVQEASVMYASQGSNDNHSQKVKNKKNFYCTHCESAGHTKDRCWKLHGYPHGHKLHNGGNNNNKNNKNVIANNIQKRNVDGISLW